MIIVVVIINAVGISVVDVVVVVDDVVTIITFERGGDIAEILVVVVVGKVELTQRLQAS